ncbi:MAG: hypothetical protein SOT13_06070 [Candidatus Aphodousia sp.]|nr:hypothetical protein [Candidatus Aphodousia sp.]
MADRTLSVEFEQTLKDCRKLGAGMLYENGKLYAVLKNFSTIIVIDIASESIKATYGLPAGLTDRRGLVKKGNAFEVLDHNRIMTLHLN